MTTRPTRLIGLLFLLALVRYSAAAAHNPGVRGIIGLFDRSGRSSTTGDEPSSSFLLQDEELHDEFTDVRISQEVNRFLQDGATDETRVNIFQQLKESLGLAILGCLLICCMPILIWKNEGRHVRELQRIDFCKNEAVAVDR
jgi:hypothetical protein